MPKSKGGAVKVSSSKPARDAGSGRFLDHAAKWAAKVTSSREVARDTLTEMGIHKRNGKLSKDYR
jgi:hypothetical protein